MKIVNLRSRKGLVNLLADYLVSKIGSEIETIIQVTDCRSFFVVNGITKSIKVLDMQSVMIEFQEKFAHLLDEQKINTIDLIEYDGEPKSNEKLWFHFLNEERILCKSLITEDDNDTLQVSSYFPYGYSKTVDRNKLYYTEYICNQLFSVIYSEKIDFMFGTKTDDEQSIEIKGHSIYQDSDIESMVLDVFEFDLESFNNTINDYDIMNDLLSPLGERPWLVRDKIRDMVII
jgi:hypothetical protein